MTNLSFSSEIDTSEYEAISDFRSIVALTLQWLWVVVFIAVSKYAFQSHYLFGLFLYPVVVVAIASRMMALGEVLGHSATHLTLFSRKSMNRKLDFLYFVPLFATFESYAREHALHHSYLLTDKDPSVQ